MMNYLFALTAVGIFLPILPLRAGDFRIETKIYDVQDDEQPISENLTLFYKGVVYDFLARPETVTIFHPPASGAPGRFVVLDRARSVKLEVTTDQIEGLLAKLKDWVAGQDDPYLRFLAAPSFREESSTGGETLTLTSEHMSYRLQTMSVTDDGMLDSYRQFSDWYARFNARGGMLPFPRLAVNEALHRRQRIPTEVVLNIPGQKLEMRSEHHLKRLLSKQDRKQIEEVHKQVNSFLSVDPEEFLHGRSERVAEAAGR